jgi:hypothetical protein
VAWGVGGGACLAFQMVGCAELVLFCFVAFTLRCTYDLISRTKPSSSSCCTMSHSGTCVRANDGPHCFDGQMDMQQHTQSSETHVHVEGSILFLARTLDRRPH